jgi:pimeloyl-ACP methyl ester carboxylesterase
LRVLSVGHSAGGHLAFWVAGRHHIKSQSEIFRPQPKLALRGAISLAGAVDLLLTIDLSDNPTFAHGRECVYRLMGGRPANLPNRYQAGNPGSLLPLLGTQILIHGTEDDQVPAELPLRWADIARGLGSHAAVKIVPKADHFDVVDPASNAWEIVLSQVKSLIARSA